MPRNQKKRGIAIPFSRLGVSRVALPAAVFAGLVAGPAAAVPFSSEIVVDAMTAFDEPSAEVDNALIQSTKSITSGGATTTATISNGIVNSGPNPIAAAFLNIGDNLSITPDADVDADPTGAAVEWDNYGFDFAIEVTNTSATNTFRVVLTVDFNNIADADGPVPAIDDGAFSESEFSVSQAGVGELLFTDLVSDTLLGDEIGGVDQGMFGEEQAESDSEELVFILAPGAMVELFGNYDTQGGAFDLDTSAFLQFSGSITVTEVENLTPAVVAVPGTGINFLGGLLLGATLLS